MKMNKKKYIAASFIYFLSGFFFLADSSNAGVSSWLIVIISAALSLPLIAAINHFIYKHDISMSLVILSGLPSVICAVVSLCGFGKFVHLCSLNNNPVWLLPVALLSVSIWAGLKTPDTLARFCAIILPAIAAAAIIFLLCAIPLSDRHYVTSYYDGDISLWIKNIAVYTFLFVLKGTVLSVVFFGSACPHNVNTIIFSGLLSASVIISSFYLITLCVLGNYTFEAIAYPVYFPLGIAEISEYLQRFEIIVLLFFMTVEFVKYAYLTAFIKKAATLFHAHIKAPSRSSVGQSRTHVSDSSATNDNP